MNIKAQNLKLDFPLSLRDLYPERWRVRPALSTVEGVRGGVNSAFRILHSAIGRFPHLPIHLFTGLMFFALLTAALPAWAATPKIAAGERQAIAIMLYGILEDGSYRVDAG